MRAARMVAATLIDHGFNLVTGNATGVDRVVATAFCFEVKHRDEDVGARFTQLRLPWYRRGSRWFLLPSFRDPSAGRVSLRHFHDWMEKARMLADAAVIIGGHGGTLTIANRFIDAGKPVFPVPFSGGHSGDVFQEILRNWCDNPVPGLSKSQFLRLSIPWVAGTGALGDLLLGTLSRAPDIFISYRRLDSEWITARLRRDLAEHFGTKRVFMDTEHIAPGQMWSDVIQASIDVARVGIIVLGPDSVSRFAEDGVAADTDVFRREITGLLRSGKPVLVVTTPEVPPPHRWQLPDDLVALAKIHTLAISPAGWDIALDQIIRTLRPLQRLPATARATI